MKPPVTRSCKRCGGQYAVRSNVQKYCSKNCTIAAYADKQRANHKKWKQRNPERVRAQAKRRYAERHPPSLHQHTCSHCGVAFLHKWRGVKYCSKNCGRLGWHYENHERSLETTRNWQRQNHEHRAASNAAWVRDNPEKVRAQQGRYRASQRSCSERWSHRLSYAKEWLAADRLSDPDKHQRWALKHSRAKESRRQIGNLMIERITSHDIE